MQWNISYLLLILVQKYILIISYHSVIRFLHLLKSPYPSIVLSPAFVNSPDTDPRPHRHRHHHFSSKIPPPVHCHQFFFTFCISLNETFRYKIKLNRSPSFGNQEAKIYFLKVEPFSTLKNVLLNLLKIN